ncbi:Uncharacterised protein [Propionibacterium australiense]|uniref:Uncharacterized protein n=2 Tax=Propionibacterium australiense TaxID=119981 RepID=A0A383S4U1_9ACTN|nr:hypothetical protein D7U36_05100 [Propionibacterium australiense]RLP12481.1 hypothetical protein D9T14_01135 [Propionibacterium australiense]SYZ32701.1 Hypothetical protein PROPAUS_0591 [Propionibacterium australiense]VEH91525.1 Uncharacterised protein [Propionibacterium australiense]
MLVRAVPTMAVVRHGADHFPELLPGITLVPAQPRSDDVLVMADEHLAAPHGGPSALYARARAALRGRPVELTPDGTAAIWAVSGDGFVSGRLGLVADYLPEPWRGSLPANGIVLAVPRAGLMLVHVPTGEDLTRALSTMSARALDEYRTGPDPLVPFLYYVCAEGRAQQLSQYDGPDGSQLVVQGAFRRVYERFIPQRPAAGTG